MQVGYIPSYLQRCLCNCGDNRYVPHTTRQLIYIDTNLQTFCSLEMKREFYSFDNLSNAEYSYEFGMMQRNGISLSAVLH